MNISTANRPFVRLVGICAGIVLATGITPPAHAEAADGPVLPGQSCWYDLDTELSVCVEAGSGLVEAVREETGIVLDIPDGAIIDGEIYHSADEAAARPETGPEASSATLAAATVVGTLYDDINYGGSTLVLTAPGSCGRYSFDNLGGYGWNDRASSYRTYAGCRGTAYRDNYLGGTASSTTANASSLGALNDQASSFRVAP